jgi:putative restriction endonuclease
VGYLVIATPKDKDTHPHAIQSVDEQLYSVRLEREAEFVYARVLGANSAPELDEPDAAADIRAIEASTEIPATEKPQLVQARRGQGLFRSRVELVEAGCRLTGVTDRAHLRAGHVKPWRDCSNTERLDGSNGLLLAPHIDHLFDRGFISFNDDGRLLVSPRLKTSVLAAWGIAGDRSVGAFSAKQRVYLAYHRENVFLSE